MDSSASCCTTWENVDVLVKHELKTNICVMRLETSSRRLFAFVAIYSFLHDHLTARTSLDSDEWCSLSASRNLLSGVADIIKALEERVKYYRRELHSLAVKHMREKQAEVDPRLVMSRHTELTDPDKKIWKRMHSAGIAPEKVITAYRKVQHLLPNEVVANYEYRSGPATLSATEEQQNLSQGQVFTMLSTKNKRDPEKMNPWEFYEKFIRSDVVVAKSNKLSQVFSENFEVLPDTNIKVPRRIERYFNIEMASAVRNNLRYPSNYIRGMILAYFIGEIFGGAFSAMHLYLLGFAMSASAACGSYVLETSTSRLKAILKSCKLFVECATDRTHHERRNSGIFPESLATVEVSNARSAIVKSINYVPDRWEKAAMAMMRSTVAEHEPDGYMAVWLALAVSQVLGRRVTPQYALLFLVNWAARQHQLETGQDGKQASALSAEEYLRRLSITVGLTFLPSRGLVLPVVGFGSGLTNTKLRQYANRTITDVVQKLLKEGKPVKERTEGNSATLNLEQISARFFKNNDIMNNSATGSEYDAERVALSSMKGEVFVPSEDRRKVHEEEYNKALNPGLKLRFRFGVCGYQHPLPASGNKQALVALQRLKLRQIYAQRETAAANNWDRILQFFFPRKTTLMQPEVVGPYTKFAVSRLSSLNRAFVETASTVLKNALPCERVLDDINIKFNADVLTLGRKPDIFLRTKAGLVIAEHARQALMFANHALGRFAECQRISKLYPSAIATDSDEGRLAIELAHSCVIARGHQEQYSELQPFIPQSDERFKPIPLFGIDNPIFPPANTYIDETATRCNDANSQFWLDETNDNMIDALVSRGILSVPILSTNRNHHILSSDSNLCMGFYKAIREMNQRDLALDKPRKVDPTPWSSKNTGQSGRSSTEFSPNSVIVLSLDDAEEEVEEIGSDALYEEEYVRGNNGDLFAVGGVRDIFLAAVETQRAMARSDIVYPQRIENPLTGRSMVQVPDICPVYLHGGKPAVITLKHSTCVKSSTKLQP